MIPKLMTAGINIDFKTMGALFNPWGLHVFIAGQLRKLGLEEDVIGTSFDRPLPSAMYFCLLFLLQFEHPG